MPVFELKVEVAGDAVAELEELFAEAEEQRLMIVEDKPSGRAWVAGYFDSEPAAQVALRVWAKIIDPEWLATEPELRELPDMDWKESYKMHFKAWSLGPLHWVPVWERETFKLPAGGQVLWFDPGMAFGTGNHETTRLCSERLVEFAGRRGAAGRVIDAGCGSGILALSAARLGFGDVVGFDNDVEAVRISRENAVLNGLETHVEFFTSDLVAGLANRQAELVLANIQADVLRRFARELSAAVAPGAELVLSGILARELDEVRGSFSRDGPGWAMESCQLGEWADLVLRRPV